MSIGGGITCPRCGYVNREGERKCSVCHYDFGRDDQLVEETLYSLPWVLDLSQKCKFSMNFIWTGGRLVITNDRLIFWGLKTYSALGLLTNNSLPLLEFLNDSRRIRLFADRSAGLRNGTYSGRLFAPEDAEVNKSLREVAPGLGADAKCVDAVYYSDVGVVELYDVAIPKGFWRSRTGVLIGFDLRKDEGHFSSVLANYRIPFLSTQELADMLKRTPLSIKDFKFNKTKSF